MIKPDEKSCCGCTACQNVCPADAITMQYNEKGFLMPVIDTQKCVDCGACRSVCRFVKRLNQQIPEKSPAVYALQKKTGRKYSQSGGAFACLAEHFLSQRGRVYGVAFDGETAHYMRVDSKAELYRLKGSKYVQAEVRTVLSEVKEALENHNTVLFSGTPCHVEGLLSFLQLTNTDTSTLYTCDLVCHGVPSPLLLKEYIGFLKSKYGEVSDFCFRAKDITGWHGHVESFRSRGKRIWSNNYVNIFYSHLELRESCYRCPYSSKNRISDITVGDCWGIEKHLASFDDNRGTSLLLLNTKKGRELKQVIEYGCRIRQITLKDYLQPNLQNPTEKPDTYDAFWKNYQQNGFLPAVRAFCGFRDGDYSPFHPMFKTIRELKSKIRGWKESIHGRKE